MTQTNNKSVLKIVVFKWKSDSLSIAKNPDLKKISETDAIDVSSHVLSSCNFSKNLGSPSGQFSFGLDNTKDWKYILKPGMWCLIYMCNDGKMDIPKFKGEDSESRSLYDIADLEPLKDYRKYLRGVCYIERVSVDFITDPTTGVIDSSYTVSGRDFGVIYESTHIWFDMFEAEKIKAQTINAAIDRNKLTGNAELLLQIHNLIFAPWKLAALTKNKDKDITELTRTGIQWLMPTDLVDVVGIKLDVGAHVGNQSMKDIYFWGNLDTKKFYDTPCRIPLTNLTTYLKGNPWQKLKELSLPPLHELFTELDEKGIPRLNFRHVPWAFKGEKKFPNIFKKARTRVYSMLIKGSNPRPQLQVKDYSGSKDVKEAAREAPFFFQDLYETAVKVLPVDVIQSSVGEDEKNRYNNFFVVSNTNLMTPAGNISVLKDTEFPFYLETSGRRHGFKPLHISLNTFNFVDNSKKNKKSNVNQAQIVEYNHFVKELWDNSIFFESGNCEIVGKNDVRIGKALYFDAKTPYLGDKQFYIEGYVDKFIIGSDGNNSWTQDLVLTRGSHTSRDIFRTGSWVRLKALVDHIAGGS